MKSLKFEKDIEKFTYNSFDAYFGDMNIAVFDIETLGLMANKHPVILGGICYFDRELTCLQYFAENLEDEEKVIGDCARELQKFDAVITFNGNRFDIPFFKKRANIFDIPLNAFPYHLDLYPVIRKFSDIKHFVPNMKQKTIEKFMGHFERTDEITGKESIELYYAYLRLRDTLLKEKILLHNSDDVFQLYRLLDVIKKTDFHAAMNALGFPFKTSCNRGIITKIEITGEKLVIKGTIGMSSGEEINFSDKINYMVNSRGGFKISFDLTPFKGYLIADLRDLMPFENPVNASPSFADDYLIVKEGRNIKTFEINMLSKLLTERIFSR